MIKISGSTAHLHEVLFGAPDLIPDTWSTIIPPYGTDRGGMHDPAIGLTPGKPFSYFWHPTDVIVLYMHPVATEVTPEGNLYTGFGEYGFFVGILPETC